MEVVLEFLESRQGAADYDTAHRMPQKAYLWNIEVLAQLVLDFTCKSYSHIFNVTLCSCLVRSRNIHFDSVVIVPS